MTKHEAAARMRAMNKIASRIQSQRGVSRRTAMKMAGAEIRKRNVKRRVSRKRRSSKRKRKRRSYKRKSKRKRRSYRRKSKRKRRSSKRKRRR